jgi:hypothetical protein
MESIQEPSTVKMITLYSTDNRRIVVPASVLSGLTVSRADFQREVEQDESCNSDPESCLEGSNCESCESWLEAFHQGEVRFLQVGARVSLVVPSMTTAASLYVGVGGVQSDADEEHLTGIWEDQRDELEEQLAALGVAVMPEAICIAGTHPTELTAYCS